MARALAAEDFFLVHGPPGTGKSTVLAEVAVQAVQRGERLLCTAASNAAVDHLLELCLNQGLHAIRMGHPARVAARLQEHTLDIMVEEHPDRDPGARAVRRGVRSASATRAASAPRAAAASASPTRASPPPRPRG